MIIKNKRIYSLLSIAAFIFGISLFAPAPSAQALDGNFEWVDSGTIRVTYEGAQGAEKTVDLKGSGSDFSASGVPGLRITQPGRTVECVYDVNLKITGNNNLGTVSSDRTNNGPGANSCDDNLFDSNVTLGSVGNAELPAGEGGATTEEESASSCHIDGIGWILCPVMYFMGGITDAAEKMVREMLQTQPLSVRTQGNPTYEAWKIVRNIANVAFVIAFLFIIFSQLTSIGIGNYGIKKLLPRLIVAGILVNVSYWICAIALDVTNVVGSATATALQDITDDMPVVGCIEVESGCEDVDGALSGGSDKFMTLIGWTIGVGVTAGVLSFIHLSVLLPLLITAVAAVVTVVVVLTIRQALLIVLIVVSPLAFVAFLLPNTENLFSKWKGLFTTLLIMYPAVALIFGVSAFASKVIMYGANSITVAIVGMFVSVIPLFITPIVMKTAGGVLNRIGGMVNNADKGIFDRSRKAAASYREDALNRQRGERLGRARETLNAPGSTLGGGAQGSKRRRLKAFINSGGASYGVNRNKQRAFEKAATEEEETNYFAERAVNEKGFAERIAGDDMAQGLKASSVGAVNKIEQQDIANRLILMKEDKEGRSGEELLLEALEMDDNVGIQAARLLLKENGASGYEKFNETVMEFASKHPDHDPAIQSVKKGIREDGKDFKQKDPAMLKWAKGVEGYEDLEEAVKKPISGSAVEIASVAPHALRASAAAGNIDVDMANTILSNPQLAANTSDKNIETLRAVIATGGQQFDANKVKDFASKAPSVSDIQRQNNTQAAPAAQPQPTAPIPPPATATQPSQPTAAPAANTQPNTPDTNGWVQRPSGLAVPPNYQPSSSGPLASAAAIGDAVGKAVGKSGGGGSVHIDQKNSYTTYVEQAGGPAKLGNAELATLLRDTQKSGNSALHDDLRKEYGKRRGSDIPSEPWVPPSQRPNGPTPPTST